MDFIKGAMGNKNEGGDNQQSGQQESNEQKSGGGGGGGFLGGLGDKMNSAAGGGKESEKNEDYLDKGETPPYPLCLPTHHITPRYHPYPPSQRTINT